MISGLPWGLALSSGVNTYLPLFLLALFARFGQVVHLSPRFAWLASDQAIFILGALALCEILAQKFPVLDNIWDFLHTLLRPIAGAVATGATLNTNNTAEIVLAMLLERNEELLGALPGWKRSVAGPRRTWVLLTSRRLLWIESRLFRNSKAQSLDYSEIALARHRNLILFARAEFLTQRHENFTLTVARAHIRFAELAAHT